MWVSLIRKVLFWKVPRSAAFFLRILLISFNIVPSCLARAFICSGRLGSSSSLCSFVFASRYSVSSSSVFLQIFLCIRLGEDSYCGCFSVGFYYLWDFVSD